MKWTDINDLAIELADNLGRVRGTSSFLANAPALMLSGIRYSSRRISPG